MASDPMTTQLPAGHPRKVRTSEGLWSDECASADPDQDRPQPVYEFVARVFKEDPRNGRIE